MDVQIIESQMRRSVLENERRMLEDKASKGKAQAEELAEKAKEISTFHEVQPLKLFADDVTAEKLASILAENHGKAAIVSAEGGIFDILNGIYTKNVNIDVFLKGHSSDTICEGEESEIKAWFKTINIAGIPLNRRKFLTLFILDRLSQRQKRYSATAATPISKNGAAISRELSAVKTFCVLPLNGWQRAVTMMMLTHI